MTESKALARSMNTAAQYCFLPMAVNIPFRNLSKAEVHPTNAPHKCIPGDYHMKVVERMPRVCEAVIKAKGGYFEES